LTSFLGPLVDRMRRSPALRQLRDTPWGARLAWRLTGWRARADGYETARLARLAERRALYAPAPEAGPFSLLTPVWNTNPAHLRALADSVFGQDGAPETEWLVHDNASSDPGTLRCLAEIARHPMVKLARSDTNLGIVGGLRACLERAGGRYVVPLDHDDWLYPDALRIVARCLVEQEFPALLYTDEDKLYGTAHCLPYAKPDWDPVLFVNAAYIAHLHALDRQRALALDLWNDRAFEGCHDWDSFARFWQAGHTPGHAREIVYGWRIHPGSTAGSARAKDFIESSQRALLQRFIAGRAAPERYAIERNPRFPGTPNWHVRRLPTAPRPVVTVALGGADDPALARWRAADGYPDHRWIDLPEFHGNHLAPLIEPARAAAAAGALLRLLGPGVEPAHDPADMLWEAVGLFELFRDVAMVGGRVLDGAGRIRTARAYFGYGRGCDSPDAGLPADAPGYQAQLWQQQSVSAVSAAHALIDPDLLCATLEANRSLSITTDFLGAWCGAQARRAGRRVVYSPFLVARTPGDDTQPIGTRAESLMFEERHGDLMPDDALRSPRLAQLGI
jgi:glycosyltransferase involved in cell wall biosynthesis